MALKKIQLTIEEIINRHVLKLHPSISLNETVKKVIEGNYKEVLIVKTNEPEELLGMLTVVELLKPLAIEPDRNRPIQDFMKPWKAYADSEDQIIHVKERMEKYRLESLPVFKKEQVIGMVRRADVLSEYSRYLEWIGQHYKPIINHLHEGLSMIDAHGKVLIWNKSAEALYGIHEKEILHRKIETFFPNALMLSVLKNRKAIRNEYHSPKANCYAVVSVAPIYVEGQFMGVVATDRDMTDYINKTSELDNANSQLKLLKEEVDKMTEGFSTIGHVYGKHSKLAPVISLAERVATTDASILIAGESGTGKEVLSRAIHKNSGRQGLFVPVNCSAIPHTLFESEFFGYVGGAFTGALQSGKTGYFELANKGTLFLDELGELPHEAQAKLLRVIQDGVVYPVGSNDPVKVDVRIISATNRKLKEMVDEGEFREDLYYRLNVVEMELPPLRERKEDIILLFNHFRKEISAKCKVPLKNVQKEVFDVLINYEWKGNIRELRNTIEHMVIMSMNREMTVASIPEYIIQTTGTAQIPLSLDALDLERAIKTLEKEMIGKALEKTHGNKTDAAKLLGIPRSTLYYKLDLIQQEPTLKGKVE